MSRGWLVFLPHSFAVVLCALVTCAEASEQTVEQILKKAEVNREEAIKDLHVCTGTPPLPVEKSLPPVKKENIAKGEVPLIPNEDGSFSVLVSINDMFLKEIVLDTASTYVQIPKNTVRMLICAGLLDDHDIIGKTRRNMANGKASDAWAITIKRLQILGLNQNYSIKMVTAVVPDEGPFTLPIGLIRYIDTVRNVFVPLTPDQCKAPRPFWASGRGGCIAAPL